MTTSWPTKQVRDEFFDKLRALLEEYPHIAGRMIAEYQDHADNVEHAILDAEQGYPAYDSDSPVFLQGLVLIVSHSNLEHFEDLTILDPYGQSDYFTGGLISKAEFMYKAR